jgi:hypothetical protein
MSIDLEDNANTGTVVPGEAAPSEPQADGTPQSDGGDEVESRARAQGWVPKEEFRGPEDKWRDAEAFVRHGEETLPILRERNKELARRLANFEEESNSRVSKLERMTTVALQRQEQQLRDSYEAAKRQAVNNADTERYDQLLRDERAATDYHNSQYVAAATPEPRQQVQPDPAVVNSWAAKNPWFTTDQEMKAVAIARTQMVARENPSITLEDNLAEAERYIRKRYPEKFTAARSSGGAAVEGGSRMSGSAAGAKGVSQLPADARVQGEKFVKQGLFKNMSEYATDYWNQ